MDVFHRTSIKNKLRIEELKIYLIYVYLNVQMRCKSSANLPPVCLNKQFDGIKSAVNLQGRHKPNKQIDVDMHLHEKCFVLVLSIVIFANHPMPYQMSMQQRY